MGAATVQRDAGRPRVKQRGESGCCGAAQPGIARASSVRVRALRLVQQGIEGMREVGRADGRNNEGRG
eukprot:5575961-Pleurochrysis_carterae.AAC.2